MIKGFNMRFFAIMVASMALLFQTNVGYAQSDTTADENVLAEQLGNCFAEKQQVRTVLQLCNG